MLSRQSSERLWPVCLSAMASCPTRSSPSQPPVWRAGAFPSRAGGKREAIAAGQSCRGAIAARQSFLLNRRRVQLGVSLFRIIFLFFMIVIIIMVVVIVIVYNVLCRQGPLSAQPSAARPGLGRTRSTASVGHGVGRPCCGSRWRSHLMSRDIAGGGDWRRLDPRGNASTPQRAHKCAKPADAIGFKRNLCEGLATSLTQAETGHQDIECYRDRDRDRDRDRHRSTRTTSALLQP